MGLPLSSSPCLTMAPEGCTIGPDGKLLNVSQIVWVNNPDNDEPMDPAATSSTVQPLLDSFVTRVPLPAHRSTCISHPSTKVIDLDNAMAIKHKPSNPPASNPSCCLHLSSPEIDEDRATEPDYSHCTDTEDSDDDSDGLVEAYEEIKALGNADHKVCVSCSSRSLIDTLPTV